MNKFDARLRHLDREGFVQTAKMLRKVRDLHLPDANFTEAGQLRTTCGGCDQAWPCETTKALGAEPEQSTQVEEAPTTLGWPSGDCVPRRSIPEDSEPCAWTGKEPIPAGPIDTYMAKAERDWEFLRQRRTTVQVLDVTRDILDVLVILVEERKP